MHIKRLAELPGNRLGVWDWHVHTAIFKTDNQQGPAVEHRELCSILCNNHIREKNLKKNRYIYIFM